MSSVRPSLLQIKLGNGVADGKQRITGVVAGTDKSLFFAKEGGKYDATPWLHSAAAKGGGDFDECSNAARVIVRPIEYPVTLSIRLCSDVIVMRREDHVLICFAPQNSDHVLESGRHKDCTYSGVHLCYPFREMHQLLAVHHQFAGDRLDG